MNAITLQDDAKKNPTPWLSMVEYEIKGIETRRNWIRKNHQGDTLLTGSATSRTPNAGKAVCVVKVVDIVPMTHAHEFKACIRLFDGASALILDDVRWLSRKFDVKGALSVFDIAIPADVEIYAPTTTQLLTLPDYLRNYMNQGHFFSMTV